MPPGLATGSGPTAEITGSGADTAVSAKPGLLTGVKRCISVGPFRDVSEAAHAATTLRGAGYDPRQRVADGEVWAGVWVYLPLPPSRSNSEQLLVKLRAGGIEDIGLDAWNAMLAVNLTGYMLCAQAFGRGMLARGAGSIVNIATMGALRW